MAADPFALRDPPQPGLGIGLSETVSPDGHRIAVCRPANHRQQHERVELIARVGEGKVLCREIDNPRRGYWSCLPLRLIDPASRRQLTQHDLSALPWQGKGADPLPALSEAEGLEGQAKLPGATS